MLFLPLVFALLLGAQRVFVGADESKPKSSAASPKPRELPAFTPQREAVALEFVQQHHAELSPVLARLKITNEAEYQQAIREIFRTTEVLASSQDAKYSALMLEAWKANSRAELLAARLACATAADARANLEKELKERVTRYVDLQRQMLQNRRQAVAATLEQMDANIKRMEESRERMIESRFQVLSRIPKKAAAAPAPAGKKSAETKDAAKRADSKAGKKSQPAAAKSAGGQKP
jgi:hypothetical protein